MSYLRSNTVPEYKQPAPVPLRARSANSSGVIPSGTALSIRSVVRIDARDTASAEGFPAVIVSNLTGDTGETLVLSGSPARLVIIPGSAQKLVLAAVMVEGSWRAVAGGTGGAPLGTLLRGVLDPYPRPQADGVSMAIRVEGADLQVPAGALLMFRTDAPIRLAGAEPVNR